MCHVGSFVFSTLLVLLLVDANVKCNLIPFGPPPPSYGFDGGLQPAFTPSYAQQPYGPSAFAPAPDMQAWETIISPFPRQAIAGAPATMAVYIPDNNVGFFSTIWPLIKYFLSWIIPDPIRLLLGI